MTIMTMEARRWSIITMEVYTSIHPIHPGSTGFIHPTTGIHTMIPGDTVLITIHGMILIIIHTVRAGHSTSVLDTAGDGDVPTMDGDTRITVLTIVTGIIPIMDMDMEAHTGEVIVTDTTMDITGVAEDTIILTMDQATQTMEDHTPTVTGVPDQDIRHTG